MAQRVPLGKPENLRVFSETVNGEFRNFAKESSNAKKSVSMRGQTPEKVAPNRAA